MDAKATIGMELFGAACILGLTAFRLYIQRKRPRRKVGAFYAYETCLWFALATNLYITGMDVWSSWREVKANFPKGTSQKELSKHLIDSKFMKVSDWRQMLAKLLGRDRLLMLKYRHSSQAEFAIPTSFGLSKVRDTYPTSDEPYADGPLSGSFIAVYFEISGHFVKRVRWMLYGVTAFVVVTYFINILMKFLWCLPFERNWYVHPTLLCNWSWPNSSPV